ncbi:MAG TPA: hypothetical protein PLJ78_17720 [Anaerolineae bacterium]|nr:hypothetical protein [Anaerolineae bacterium]HQK15771.1 hypothetical protein [Anaerolineae bacterium]
MTTPNITYNQILNLTKGLGREEQLQLLEALTQWLRHTPKTQTSHSILELRGLGKDIWQNMDVDAYINQERDSWDG